MRQIVGIALAWTVLGCCALLVLSTWPGAVDAALQGSLLLLPAALLAALVVWIVLLVRARRGALTPVPWRIAAAIPAVALVTLGLLVLQVPRRAVFAVARPAFERAAAEVDGADRVRADRWIGPYRVDEVASDEGGAVWFRVSAHAEGFGSDTLSSGFVRDADPRKERTPFGSARTILSPLWGRWRSFSVSNDY